MKKNISLIMVWAGQMISLFGSGLTGFALGVWLYQQTGSASNFALVALCSALPQMLLSPLVGVWVDRYNRRKIMALADSGAALCSLVIAILFLSGHIQVWHIFLITALSSSCGALQAPAYSALVATVIPKDQLVRANGMIQLGQALADILAPALSGVLLLAIGIPGVLLIDLATFVIGITTLLLSRIQAAPPAMQSQIDKKASIMKEMLAGIDVLRSDKTLVRLLTFQAIFSFLWSLFGVLVTPMILGFATPVGLGVFLTVAGTGMLTGSLVMSAWGGPKRRLAGLLAFEAVSAAAFILMGIKPDLLWVAIAAFIAHFTLAFVSGLNESLWQSQTPRETQGRVFALKQTVVKASVLLAYIAATGLADRVLQPLLQTGGALVETVGKLVGTGPGRGISLLFILIGLMKGLAASWLGSSQTIGKIDQEIAAHPMQEEA